MGYILDIIITVDYYLRHSSVPPSITTPAHSRLSKPENDKSLYYWKYFIPADKVLKQKVQKYDTKVLLTKMLLIRQQYSSRIGDNSTIRGLIHSRYGLKNRK